MDMTFNNKAMQPMSGFGIQFNKNSFGLAPAQPLNVPSIPPNQSVDVSLPLNTSGAVQKMDPLTNLQVRNRRNIKGTKKEQKRNKKEQKKKQKK